jgi:hypothetical protein
MDTPSSGPITCFASIPASVVRLNHETGDFNHEKVCVFVYVCICECVYVYVCICVYACVCARKREKERQKESEIDATLFVVGCFLTFLATLLPALLGAFSALFARP